jgi:TonB family protein
MQRKTIPPAAALLCLAACAQNPAALTPLNAMRPTTAQPNWHGTRVSVHCAVTPQGRTTDCHVVTPPGDPAFAAPAVEYALSQPMLPAPAGSGPRDIDIDVGFEPANEFMRSEAPPQNYFGAVAPLISQSLAGGAPVRVTLSCTILATGYTADCTVLDNGGHAELNAPALNYADKIHYDPAWHHGHLVAAPNHQITLQFDPPMADFGNTQPPSPPRPKGAVLTPEARRKFPPIPDSMADHGTEAQVEIVCDIAADGTTSNCAVAGQRGDPAGAKAALAFYESEKFPATLNGQPVALPRYHFVISFTQDHNKL